MSRAQRLAAEAFLQPFVVVDDLSDPDPRQKRVIVRLSITAEVRVDVPFAGVEQRQREVVAQELVDGIRKQLTGVFRIGGIEVR